jgi:hypothetical protein
VAISFRFQIESGSFFTDINYRRIPAQAPWG